MTEDELSPLTVNQLLLGHNTDQTCSYDETGELQDIVSLKEYSMNVLKSWWKEWKVQGFPHLLPLYKKADVERHTNLKLEMSARSYTKPR